MSDEAKANRLEGFLRRREEESQGMVDSFIEKIAGVFGVNAAELRVLAPKVTKAVDAATVALDVFVKEMSK